MSNGQCVKDNDFEASLSGLATNFEISKEFLFQNEGSRSN